MSGEGVTSFSKNLEGYNFIKFKKMGVDDIAYGGVFKRPELQKNIYYVLSFYVAADQSTVLRVGYEGEEGARIIDVPGPDGNGRV